MDVFDLRDKIVSDYQEYVSSFVQLQDSRIREYVQGQLNAGTLWPEPLLQLNPAFERGASIEELVTQEILHPECSRIFRLGKGSSSEAPLVLHKHQEEAVRIATSGEHYILTTGTGSGKSLGYIVPIVDHILKNGSGRGTQAIIVYPMNALANSQLQELEKFITLGYPAEHAPVKFARFTGQEDEGQRHSIRSNPPDILLTNYVMLELLLTRPEDRGLISSAGNLRYLVLDELHTYRGRQGADVAMLIRRLRTQLGREAIQCVGTSATLATSGSFQNKQSEIAEVASKFFGVEFQASNIVGETLTRVTPERDLNDQAFIQEVAKHIETDKELPLDFESFARLPIASWIESVFGVEVEENSGRLIRKIPTTITGNNGAAEKLAAITQQSKQKCEDYIRKSLLEGTQVRNPETDFPVFAFRLHQFVSPGDTVYSSLENPNERYITVNYQQFVPDRNREALLFPLAFCRECGQEYYCISRQEDAETGYKRITSRSFTNSQTANGATPAYIYVNPEKPWPDDMDGAFARVPEDWLEEHRGSSRVRTDRRDSLPINLSLTPLGEISEPGVNASIISHPFRFCLNCGVAYNFRQNSDYGKLSTLNVGGRSTSTTVLSLASTRYLQAIDSLPQEAKKLLSFTDNRQDAALQSGHFNDFVETSILRSALYKALKDSIDPLRHDELAEKIFQALGLSLDAYALNPGIRYAGRDETNEALRDLIGYKIYRDLQRGWRVTTPNLEQTGLLQIEYRSLHELCADEAEWTGRHAVLSKASPGIRAKVATTLLDFMRRELAIQVSYLEKQTQERIRQRSGQYLIAPWAIDENEIMESSKVLYPRSRRTSDFGGSVYLSARGGFGQYLSRPDTFDNSQATLTLDDRGQIILDLLDLLYMAGITEIVDSNPDGSEAPGYQLKAASMLWRAGDGKHPYHDPIRVPRKSSSGGRTNPYFVKFYQSSLSELGDLRSREHTAQVPYEEREKREQDFRSGKLPILYCSPTMELGIDIASLNLVNMRNVPPTPANYAQRSGRAGRSGQPALVITYCAKGSPHDQYFFNRQEKMVSGEVNPPRIDLANEELIRTHLHAIWLAESKLQLSNTLRGVLELSVSNAELPLQERVRASLDDQSLSDKARRLALSVLSSLEPLLNETDWFSSTWVDKVFNELSAEFDKACKRWRDLYIGAQNQLEHAARIIRDPSRTQDDRNRAERLHKEAVNQLNLLMEERVVFQSDFYTYRYFASEGFLPGYNFPRLPLSAYIPARRLRTEDGDYLSRPRFLAISEFGPRSIVYHEGSKYVINRVIMQIGKVEPGDEILATSKAKFCSECGYFHPLKSGDGVDLCERCKEPLEPPIDSLFRMQNVSTKRRDRINSDEEERFRLGYDIQTAFRFHQDNGELAVNSALLRLGEKTLAQLTYGGATNIWRVNKGWRRRKEEQPLGFTLDIDSGYWQGNEAVDEDVDDPMGPRIQRVVPYVEDRKNCLLFEPTESLSPEIIASLAAALKHAIQIQYQLEDSELTVEPLPTRDDRKKILFYEASEGGAGVLKKLVEDKEAIHEIAKQALRICHFDPETGQDKGRSETSTEECTAACYDCMLSYYNQADHPLLDRTLIAPILLEFTKADLQASPNVNSREEHLAVLRRLCGSELEREWLEHIATQGYRLPTVAQKLIESCQTRPDFLYEDDFTAIYIDGPHHSFPDRQDRDKDQQNCLEDLGYTVIRFNTQDDWDSTIGAHPNIFGASS